MLAKLVELTLKTDTNNNTTVEINSTVKTEHC